MLVVEEGFIVLSKPLPEDMARQDGNRHPQVGSHDFDTQSGLGITEKAGYFALLSPLWDEKPHKMCYYNAFKFACIGEREQ